MTIYKYIVNKFERTNSNANEFERMDANLYTKECEFELKSTNSNFTEFKRIRTEFLK